MEQTKYDVFICYSRKDYVDENKNVIPGNEVSKIKEALTQAGITYWFDEEAIYSGDKFTEKIVTNIEASHIFLFLSTQNACESLWTSKEIACADEFGKYIIPVRIDRTPYNKKVMFRIADLSYVDYGKNPGKGCQEIVASVKAFLNKIKASEAQAKAEEKRRQEELERQRKQQEEEKKRQEKIIKFESKIAALESQRTEREKALLQKEHELKLVRLDLKVNKENIQKLQAKLEELRNPNKVLMGKEADEVRIAEEKHRTEERTKEQVFTVGKVSFKMIRVDGGTFTMGATSEQGSDAQSNEKPMHKVTLSTFYIAETEVTQELWEAVMGRNPSFFKGANRPVENVSWNDCETFISKLNSRTGKMFRLPTEAEWEFAARGGNKSHGYKYSGSNTLDSVVWYKENSAGETHPVKTKYPNELGLYDMSGNVKEWCQDWYGKYASSTQSNPTGPSSGSNRVFRGGSWLSLASDCRVALRYYNSPTVTVSHLGLRLAL